MREVYKVKKGDIVRLVKANTFDYVEHPYIAHFINKNFEVVDVNKYRITVLRDNTKIECYAEYFYDYFKVVKVAKAKDETETNKKQNKVSNEKPVEKKTENKKWTDWTTIKIFGEDYAYKTDGKTVILRNGGCKGVSKCHDEDEFNLTKGLEIAFNRLVAMRTEKAINNARADLDKKVKVKKRTV